MSDRILPFAKGRLGVISDTHGLLRPDATEKLAGVDAILHAGDIGGADILRRLDQIAPTVAVRGNNDRMDWAKRLNEIEQFRWGEMRLLMIHDVGRLGAQEIQGAQCIISGHSHRAQAIEKNGVLWLNPGSAGPRRFKLGISLALIEVKEGRLEPTIVSLTA